MTQRACDDLDRILFHGTNQRRTVVLLQSLHQIADVILEAVDGPRLQPDVGLQRMVDPIGQATIDFLGQISLGQIREQLVGLTEVTGIGQLVERIEVRVHHRGQYCTIEVDFERAVQRFGVLQLPTHAGLLDGIGHGGGEHVLIRRHQTRGILIALDDVVGSQRTVGLRDQTLDELPSHGHLPFAVATGFFRLLAQLGIKFVVKVPHGFVPLDDVLGHGLAVCREEVEEDVGLGVVERRGRLFGLEADLPVRLVGRANLPSILHQDPVPRPVGVDDLGPLGVGVGQRDEGEVTDDRRVRVDRFYVPARRLGSRSPATFHPRFGFEVPGWPHRRATRGLDVHSRPPRTVVVPDRSTRATRHRATVLVGAPPRARLRTTSTAPTALLRSLLGMLLIPTAGSLASTAKATASAPAAALTLRLPAPATTTATIPHAASTGSTLGLHQLGVEVVLVLAHVPDHVLIQIPLELGRIALDGLGQKAVDHQLANVGQQDHHPVGRDVVGEDVELAQIGNGLDQLGQSIVVVFHQLLEQGTGLVLAGLLGDDVQGNAREHRGQFLQVGMDGNRNDERRIFDHSSA